MENTLQGRPRATLIAAILAIAGSVTWISHEVLSVSPPSFDGPFDWTIHVITCVLKLATILAFPIAIRPLYDQLHRNPRNVMVFSLFFGLGYLGLFALYMLFGRERMAEFASGDAVRFYYLHSPALDERHYIGLAEWRAQWARWIPQAKEIGLMVVAFAALVGPGYFLGSRVLAQLISAVSIVTVCVLLPPVLGLVLWDYDLFLGGVFFDLLSLDLIPVLWWWAMPCTFVYFVLAATFYSYVYIFCKCISSRRENGVAIRSAA